MVFGRLHQCFAQSMPTNLSGNTHEPNTGFGRLVLYLTIVESLLDRHGTDDCIGCFSQTGHQYDAIRMTKSVSPIFYEFATLRATSPSSLVA